jgi:hypothetical protein
MTCTDDRALVAGVGRDPAHRFLDGSGDDVDADLLIACELQLLNYLGRSQQRDTAARHNTLFDGRLGRVHRVLDARFLFLHLVSVAAPTLMIATPPTSLASRSCRVSRSYSDVVSSTCARSCLTRPSIDAGLPAPSTRVVLSFSIVRRRSAR